MPGHSITALLLNVSGKDHSAPPWGVHQLSLAYPERQIVFLNISFCLNPGFERVQPETARVFYNHAIKPLARLIVMMDKNLCCGVVQIFYRFIRPCLLKW